MSKAFPRLLSILYATFHPTQGPSVQFQIPPPDIQPTKVDFDTVSDWIIPRQSLCNRLIAIRRSGYRILGHPTCIHNRIYARNAFIFNLAFVFEEDSDIASYSNVIIRLATMLKQLEEESKFLSAQDVNPVFYNAMEQLLEDMNNFCECMIPINDANTVNLKLFPTHQDPIRLKPYHVPICTVQLGLLMDVNWDLMMLKLTPFIDGINSIKRIAELADTDFDLTRKCLEHLLHYDCLIVIDIFQFSNIYAPTPDISDLLHDTSLQQELEIYISRSRKHHHSPTHLFQLYASLAHGKTVHAWALENHTQLTGIDIRRFITFGVIKRLLYRVHRYPVVSQPEAIEKSLPLVKYLDGTRHFDDLCTHLQCSVKEAEQTLSAYGAVYSIYK